MIRFNGVCNHTTCFMYCGVDDSVGWNLFAKILDLVAIIGEDRLDQILADVMHVPIDRRQDDLALADTFLDVQEAFQMGDGFTNLIIPTSGVTMGVLGMARIPYEKWFSWMWPLQIILFVLALLLLIPPVLMNWGPF